MATAVVDLARYDLTKQMAPYLDPHFMFPIMRWLREKCIYSDAEILAAEYQLGASASNMVHFIEETHKQLLEASKSGGHDTSHIPAPELTADAVRAEFQTRTEASKNLWSLLEDKEKVQALKKEGKFNLEGVVESGVPAAEVDAVFDLARFYHRCGLYKQALECIVLYRKLGAQDGSYRYFSTMWAQLAECICMLLNPDTPSTKRPLSSIGGNEPSDFALRVLRDTIEKRTTLEGVKEVEQRRWMMHWALFVIYSRPNPANELFDLFFSQREARSEQRLRKNDYLAIAQAVSPWLLRYVSYSAVLNHKNLGKREKQFIQVLKAEQPNYSGPMTRLYVALFDECDMDGALAAVRDCADVIRGDFFLGHMAAKVRGGVEKVVQEFQQAALRIVFYEILKLHQELGFEKAVAKYFGDFRFVSANTLRLWVSELDRSGNSSSNSKPMVDESKESVMCHQLFNVQITTIHQRIDQQTNELKNTANKLRNRLNEDRAFERDMNGSGGLSRGTGGNIGGYSGNNGGNYGGNYNKDLNDRNGSNNGKQKKRDDDFELTPFQNPINSRDPRNQPNQAQSQRGDKDAALQVPVPTNTRWQQEPEKKNDAATATVATPTADDQNWQRSQQQPNTTDSESWERAPKPVGSADSSSWRAAK